MEAGPRAPSFQIATDSLLGNSGMDFVPRQRQGWRLRREEKIFRLQGRGTRRSIRCNPTAAMVWELIDGQRSIQEISKALEDGYALPAEESARDVRQTLDIFNSFGAIDASADDSPITHSIVTWDSSFREMFHLLRSLAETHYDLDRTEVILVEQRSRREADTRARTSGVLSAGQVAEDVRDRLPVRVLYLDEPESEPYHPGRLLNAGISVARGRIISTMDADVLVPPDFLIELDRFHDRPDRVATIFRHQAPRPLGVTLENWTRQKFDYQSVLSICPTRDRSIPVRVSNKAPLISADRRHWYAIGGYDGHRLFSTAYTLFGRDVSLRFSLLLGNVERTLPVACVHPWHPAGLKRSSDSVQALFNAQKEALRWTGDCRLFDVRSRKAVDDELYKLDQHAIEKTITAAGRGGLGAEQNGAVGHAVR